MSDISTPAMPPLDVRSLVSPDELVAGVLDIAGARALALDAFLRVSRVEWSTAVGSACIECADRPRLLLNPMFVARWCRTPERLAALLMHELAHVSMGHTRLFPNPTVAHNIACDAIINREIASLAAEHEGDVHALTALFTEYYAAHEAPWFLLRPPPEWPHAPDWDASEGAPHALRVLHRKLYDPYMLHMRFTVQYADIVDALQQAAAPAPPGRRRSVEGVVLPADCSALLGAHGNTAQERRALTSGRDAVGGEVFGAALRPMAGRLAGAGGDLVLQQVQQAKRRADLERALQQLLVRCADRGAQRQRVTWESRPARSAMPHRDRRAPVRVALAQAFGAPRPLFFHDEVQLPRPVPQGATIYLDTSGSMHGVLPVLHASLVALRRRLRPRILLFSTIVAEASAQDFDAGRLRTTGGTNIDPVLQHLLHEVQNAEARGRTRARTVVVLTDGYFGAPATRQVQALREHGVQLHLGVVGPGPLHEGEPWVASSTRLPAL